MDLGVLLTLLEAAEGEGRSAGHGRQRVAAEGAPPPVVGSFALGGGSRDTGRGRRGEPAVRRGDELSRAVNGGRNGGGAGCRPAAVVAGGWSRRG